MNYEQKYLKYKKKYLNIKKMHAGTFNPIFKTLTCTTTSNTFKNNISKQISLKFAFIYNILGYNIAYNIFNKPDKLFDISYTKTQSKLLLRLLEEEKNNIMYYKHSEDSLEWSEFRDKYRLFIYKLVRYNNTFLSNIIDDFAFIIYNIDYCSCNDNDNDYISDKWHESVNYQYKIDKYNNEYTNQIEKLKIDADLLLSKEEKKLNATIIDFKNNSVNKSNWLTLSQHKPVDDEDKEVNNIKAELNKIKAEIETSELNIKKLKEITTAKLDTDISIEKEKLENNIKTVIEDRDKSIKKCSEIINILDNIKLEEKLYSNIPDLKHNK